MITTINEFKQFLNESENTIDGILHINLLDKYGATSDMYRQKFEEYKSQIKGFTEMYGNFEIGDIIEFNGGYNNDIRYTTEILGFDQDGDIYLLWDSYWFPIKDEEKRAIKMIKKNIQYDQDYDAMDDQTLRDNDNNYMENESVRHGVFPYFTIDLSDYSITYGEVDNDLSEDAVNDDLYNRKFDKYLQVCSSWSRSRCEYEAKNAVEQLKKGIPVQEIAQEFIDNL